MRNALTLLLFVVSFVSTAATANFYEFPEAPEGISDPDVLRFQKDLDGIQSLRIETKRLYDHVAPIVAAGKPLSGDDLRALDLNAKRHSDYSKELAGFIHLGEKEKVAYPLGVSQATHLALELAASITFTDSIAQVVSMFEASPELREILNRPNPEFGRPTDLLYTTMLSYYSVSHYDRRVRLIGIFETARTLPALKASPDLQYLSSVITASVTYRKYSAQTPKQRSAERSQIRKLRLALETSKQMDRLSDFGSHRVVGTLSKLFGNAVGSIQFRDGKLKNNAVIAAQMKKILKAGDILLEATPFRATSYFIPGHYGHVALWIGTDAELLDLGLVSEKSIWAHLREIQKGASILEALRTGVTLNPVEHFLDIDDLLILRPNAKISAQQIKEAILSGMTHIGQPYDFNFDNESNDKIVCSELAFATYPSVPFRQDRTLGRWTINPDAVAEQGLPGGWFTPIMMVDDGKLVTGNIQAKLKAELKK